MVSKEARVESTSVTRSQPPRQSMEAARRTCVAACDMLGTREYPPEAWKSFAHFSIMVHVCPKCPYLDTCHKPPARPSRRFLDFAIEYQQQERVYGARLSIRYCYSSGIQVAGLMMRSIARSSTKGQLGGGTVTLNYMPVFVITSSTWLPGYRVRRSV